VDITLYSSQTRRSIGAEPVRPIRTIDKNNGALGKNSIMPKIHYTRFPVTSPCYQLVDRKKLATSRCNGIWETTQQNRHNGKLPAPTCYALAAGKLV